MKKFRILVLAVECVMALLFPRSEFGFFVMLAIMPYLLGLTIFWLYPERSILSRSAILFSLVSGVALFRICWEAIFWERNWKMDGEWDLVVTGVIFQLIFAALGGGTWLGLQAKRNLWSGP